MKALKNVNKISIIMWICAAIFLVMGFPDPFLIAVAVICGVIGYIFNKRKAAGSHPASDLPAAGSQGSKVQSDEKKAHYYMRSKPANIFTMKWYDIAKKEFIAIDLETTGLRSLSDKIIQISAIKYVDAIETDKFVSMVNPEVEIPNRVTQANGITDEMVKGSPTIKEIMPSFLKFLGNSLIVANNAIFDLEFIEVNANNLGYTRSWNYADTTAVAKKMFSDLPNYRQETILNAIGYKQNADPGSEDDCRSCAEIIKFTLNNLEYPNV